MFAALCLSLGGFTVWEGHGWSATLREWHPRVLAGSGLLGLCLLIAGLFWADRRWEIAEIGSAVALVFAISCVVAGLSESGACLTLPVAVVTLLLSIGVLIVAATPPQAVDPRLCEACGYDLTGNLSGVCPECGKRISGKRQEVDG